MTGAELLALARHSRGAGETDTQTAQHLVAALSLLMDSLKPSQSIAVHRMLQRMDDQPEYDQGITPWTR